ncbi:recombination-associated protein RdgC [Alishewanella sp. SMS9]|nr:recombination-associated protein RdgC [Alishewanella sp. SMS9]
MKFPILKKASVYAIELPTVNPIELEQAFEKFAFKVPSESQVVSMGFASHPLMQRLVVPLSNGFVFAFKRSEKKIPAAALENAIAEKAEQEGLSLGELDYWLQLREEVTPSLIASALADESTIYAFYHNKSQRLIIGSINKKHCNELTAYLVKALEKVKTQTVHLDSNTQGITQRTLNTIEKSNDNWGEFELGEYIKLTAKVEKIKQEETFKNVTQEDFAQRVSKIIIEDNYKVEELSLKKGECNVVLTKDFSFKSVTFNEVGIIDANSDQYDNQEDLYIGESAAKLELLNGFINDLLTLIGLPEEQEKQAA